MTDPGWSCLEREFGLGSYVGLSVTGQGRPQADRVGDLDLHSYGRTEGRGSLLSRNTDCVLRDGGDLRREVWKGGECVALRLVREPERHGQRGLERTVLGTVKEGKIWESSTGPRLSGRSFRTWIPGQRGRQGTPGGPDELPSFEVMVPLGLGSVGGHLDRSRVG